MQTILSVFISTVQHASTQMHGQPAPSKTVLAKKVLFAGTVLENNLYVKNVLILKMKKKV